MQITKTEGILLAVVFISFTAIGLMLLLPGSVVNPPTETKISVIAVGYVKEDIDADVVASCSVYIYDSMSPNPAEPAFDTATTDANGKYTLTVMVNPGQTLYAQVRKAVPASADPYISPLTPITIPAAAESGDTVSIGTIYVRDASAAAPTMGVTDGVNSISDNTANYVNTTDTRLVVTLSGITSNTWYGSQDFVDAVTGKSYWGAVIVWKGTANQPFSGYDAIVNTPTYVYYVWKISSFKNSASDTNDDFATISILASTTLVADTTVTINAYDVVDYVQMLNGVFTSLLTVSTLTTKVA